MSDIKRVVIMGAGGVGFWLTVALRRDQPNLEIIVYDDDDFEGGFGAQRLPHVANKKMKKVDYLNNYIQMVMRDPKIGVLAGRLTGVEVYEEYGPSDLLVDCTDMGLEARQPIWKAAREKDCNLLRVSYDGNGIVVIARGLPFSTNPGGRYSIVPTMAQSLWAGGVGAAAVEKLLKGEEVSDCQMELPGGLK